MKLIAIALLSIQMTLFAAVGNAQVVPPPPIPPINGGSSSYSFTQRSGETEGKSQEKVSISISNSDDSYMLRAKFPKEKNREVEEVLLQEMKISNMRMEEGKQVWSSNSHGEEVYEVILSTTKLSMFLDKEIASSGLVDKFEKLGVIIRQVITGAQGDMRQEAEKMQREADRLRAEADRMQHEAERLTKDAERTEPDNIQRYIDDATRLAEEASRIAEMAGELNLEASHKGGVSSIIKELLNDHKTYVGANFKSAKNWTWPDAQSSLIAALLKDGNIDSENDISFTKDDTGAYINGKKLGTTHLDRYMRIFSTHKLALRDGFSFYKKDGHIVLIGANANIEGFIEDMVSRGYFSSKRAEVKLQINGSSAYKNGVLVSGSDLVGYNELMLKNNIIPVPGKIFEIMKAGNYKLGYSAGEKTHIGTWQFDN